MRQQYILQQAMILNKLKFGPFSPTISKQQSPTPRLLTKNKKINCIANQMQILQYTENQPLNFDDSFYFTELHKKISSKNKKSKQFKTKKCVSQILSIKKIYKNSSLHHYTQQNNSTDRSKFIGVDPIISFELSNNVKWDGTNQKSKFCYTSHSSRRKQSMNKPSQEYNKSNPQRPLTQQKKFRKKFSFIKNKLPFSLQTFTKNVKSSTFQKHDLRMATFQMQINDETKQSAKAKKSNFFQYSIIRPNQIKPLALKKREKDSQNDVNRKKEYRMIYQQMLQQMKRKEQIIKRNTAIKQQRLREETQVIEQRIHIPTCYSKRKTIEICLQQKNEVKPWQVQGQSQLISNFDIL